MRRHYLLINNKYTVQIGVTANWHELILRLVSDRHREVSSYSHVYGHTGTKECCQISFSILPARLDYLEEKPLVLAGRILRRLKNGTISPKAGHLARLVRILKRSKNNFENTF